MVGFVSRVEMTTYHVGLCNYLEVFKSVGAEYVKEPYRAWTAIEVAGFVREAEILKLALLQSLGNLPNSAPTAFIAAV